MEKYNKYAGVACIAGGILGVLLAPIMVIIKYLTGWAIIPEPAWIELVSPMLYPLLSFGPPTELWTTYGLLYTIALVLMFTGLLALWPRIMSQRNRVTIIGYCIFMVGLCLIIPGDAVHSITWHQNGITKPTPGSNFVANTGYAAAMMGMNFVIIGSLLFGIAGLRKKFLPTWLAWGFVLITPSAILLSLTLLPTTPSGGLWLLSAVMIAMGYSMTSGRLAYQRVR
jgi:hypothetical protein